MEAVNEWNLLYYSLVRSWNGLMKLSVSQSVIQQNADYAVTEHHPTNPTCLKQVYINGRPVEQNLQGMKWNNTKGSLSLH